MRFPSSYAQRRRAADSTMTPMIDVVFLLLIFFVWTASFRIVEEVLPSRVSEEAGQSNVATDTPPPEADFNDVVVRVLYGREEAVRWTVNDQAVPNLQQVRDRLQTIFAINAAAPVIVHPDPDTPLQYVIDAYDITRAVGFDEVQFAVQP